MANTYTLIASYTATGTVSDITFSSIPSTYTDLCVKYSLRSNSTSGTTEYCLFRFNNDSGSNYTTRSITAGGTSTSSGTRASQTELWSNNSSTGANDANDTANTFSNGEIYIPNYLSSTQKSASIDDLAENNSTTTNKLGLAAGIWTGTAAINAIKIFPLSGSWVQYTTAYLYGIKNS